MGSYSVHLVVAAAIDLEFTNLIQSEAPGCA